MPTHQQVIIDTVLSFQTTPDRTREAAVKSFINAELAAQTDFFDTIETKPHRSIADFRYRHEVAA